MCAQAVWGRVELPSDFFAKTSNQSAAAPPKCCHCHRLHLQAAAGGAGGAGAAGGAGGEGGAGGGASALFSTWRHLLLPPELLQCAAAGL